MVLFAQAVVVVLALLRLPLEAGSQAINNSCPAVNITSHKAYASFSPQYDDPQLWIVLCTDLRDTNIACNWDYFGDPVTRPHNASSRTDQTPDGSCTNCSLVLYNVTYADSDGHYTVDAMSSCGSRNSALFDLAVSGCPCGENPPEAYGIPNVLVVEADTPLNFTLPNVITFRGCANRNDFSARVSLPTGPICLDNQPYENFKCVRQDMNCRFTESLAIINPTVSNSGNYCAQAVSNPGGGPDGNSTCFFLDIYPRPRISGPEMLYNTQFRTSTEATLQWKVCNYSHALTIVASKNGANYTRFWIDDIVTEPNCRHVTVRGPAGTYQLLVMFNTSVDVKHSGFTPIVSFPGVINDLGYDGYIAVIVIASFFGVMVFILTLLESIGVVGCICYLCRRPSGTNSGLVIQDGRQGSRRRNVDAGIPQTAYDVFISYKNEEFSEKCATAIDEHLSEAGYKVYRDEKNLAGGTTISKELAAAIHNSSVFLPILCSQYVTEPGECWCQSELDYAKEKKRRFLPVVFKGVDIPGHILLTIGSQIKRIEYDSSNPQTCIEDVTRSIQGMLGSRSDVPLPPMGEQGVPGIDGTDGTDGDSELEDSQANQKLLCSTSSTS